MDYYRYSDDCVKGLVLCSSKKEAAVLSEKFNERVYWTMSLAAKDSQEAKEVAIEHIVTEYPNNYLDYIYKVDIFDEGVDVLEFNGSFIPPEGRIFDCVCEAAGEWLT